MNNLEWVNLKTYKNVLEHRRNCKLWGKSFCLECFGGGLTTFYKNVEIELNQKYKVCTCGHKFQLHWVLGKPHKCIACECKKFILCSESSGVDSKRETTSPKDTTLEAEKTIYKNIMNERKKIAREQGTNIINQIISQEDIQNYLDKKGVSQ